MSEPIIITASAKFVDEKQMLKKNPCYRLSCLYDLPPLLLPSLYLCRMTLPLSTDGNLCSSYYTSLSVSEFIKKPQ